MSHPTTQQDNTRFFDTLENRVLMSADGLSNTAMVGEYYAHGDAGTDAPAAIVANADVGEQGKKPLLIVAEDVGGEASAGGRLGSDLLIGGQTTHDPDAQSPGEQSLVTIYSRSGVVADSEPVPAIWILTRNNPSGGEAQVEYQPGDWGGIVFRDDSSGLDQPKDGSLVLKLVHSSADDAGSKIHADDYSAIVFIGGYGSSSDTGGDPDRPVILGAVPNGEAETDDRFNGKYMVVGATHRYADESPTSNVFAVWVTTGFFEAVPQTSSADVYDYPGEYAQRFDGIDKGDKGEGYVLTLVEHSAREGAAGGADSTPDDHDIVHMHRLYRG